MILVNVRSREPFESSVRKSTWGEEISRQDLIEITKLSAICLCSSIELAVPSVISAFGERCLSRMFMLAITRVVGGQP